MKGNNKIDIQHPEAWDLLVAINGKRLDYILYTPTVANSLIVGEVTCADDSLQSLEDTVYETPVLLGDYHRVRVLVHSSHFVLLPAETGDDDCESLVRQAFPNDDGDAVVSTLKGNGVKIACLLPRGMSAFLGRTFNYPEIAHHLLPLYEHYIGMCGGGLNKLFMNLTADSLDIAVYRDQVLQFANSYPYTGVQDAVYYAMNVWRTCGLEQLTDELLLTGDNEQRAALTPELRKYVKSVMPADFPAAAMQLGRNAMQAPFELIMLALCE